MTVLPCHPVRRAEKRSVFRRNIPHSRSRVGGRRCAFPPYDYRRLDGRASSAMLVAVITGPFPLLGDRAMPNITPIDVATVRRWLGDGGEIAFIDVREDGQHGEGHPLLAVSLPYSRLELGVRQLVPRRSCRVVLVDD